MNSSNFRFTNQGSNPWEIIKGTDTISWERFFTRFGFAARYMGHFQKPNGKLMALTCAPPGMAGDTVGVDTIIVRTKYDFNSKYPTGSVINDIVLINDWTLYPNDFDDFVTLSEYLAENSEGVKEETFELKLTEEPESDAPFSFDVTYILNNGEKFTNQSEEVDLLK